MVMVHIVPKETSPRFLELQFFEYFFAFLIGVGNRTSSFPWWWEKYSYTFWKFKKISSHTPLLPTAKIDHFFKLWESITSMSQSCGRTINLLFQILTYNSATLGRVCQCNVNYVFQMDGLGSSSNSIAGYYNLRLAIKDPLGQRFRGESSKNNLYAQGEQFLHLWGGKLSKKMVIQEFTEVQYRVNSTNSSTSKHSYGQFHEHGQINQNSITLPDANVFQVICKLSSMTHQGCIYYLLTRLHIARRQITMYREEKSNLANSLQELVVSQSGINTRFVPFPIDCNLFTIPGSNIGI